VRATRGSVRSRHRETSHVILGSSMATLGDRSGEGLRLAELLAALSLATDVAHQVPAESALKDALLSVAFARHLGLPEADLSDVYYLALLYHLGCTAAAEEQGRVSGGDDGSVRRGFSEPDFTDNMQIFRLAVRELANTLPAADRVRAVGSFMTAGKDFMLAAHDATCEAAARLAERLGVGANVSQALNQVFARWDGKMFPTPPAEGVSVIARITHLVHVAQIYAIVGGPAAAAEVVRKRRGSEFDPKLADTFVGICPDLFKDLGAGSVWEQTLDAEPAPYRLVPRAHLDEVTLTIADFTDIKSPFTLGHSRRVSQLAEAAGSTMGLSATDLQLLRQSAHVHDLGNVSVPQRVWMKNGLLNRPEKEAVRLHTYQTERILSASRSLQPIGAVAGLHHERLDGSGYHRGAPAASLPQTARVLAAAEVFESLLEERSWRPALTRDQATDQLAQSASSGGLDRVAVRALLEASGEHIGRRRVAWPSGLTDREVEVLRLLASGRANRAIAKTLSVSQATVHTHTINIYSKTGVHSRGGIALYAVEHDLTPLTKDQPNG
jgi:response regulator RpfG family c-di-GMP phosphodiesterase/DNA-binding CsgD family transcriptional regulator